ncbi:DNA polymerase ligase N-terminal domain-containing protein [Yinghuangia sp. YIM S10712]|uniref:DNA polymerase ligase N-terminal domain-containing protein n=1 Tax=Yinghuangia sp. YIM S10712 TaxID=3436930 RepID=UPI003F52BF53
MASKDSHRTTGPRHRSAQDHDGPLADYRRKRDFDKTAEPEGAHAPAEPGEAARFVVQIHDASRMHFDFRLEVDGVLKSWAVPKGPSHDPTEKRLAVPTEDHPLDYHDFEGIIAQGEYGGGTVIVWDQGTYRSLATDRRGNEVPFAEALAAGHASFWMDGAKLHGGYALTRTRGGAFGDNETWLLVKRKDRHADKTDAPDPWRARSVLTGRTLRQVAAESADEASRDDGD